METSISLKEIDFLIRRNWFLDYESLIQVLDMADEDSWEWIIKNRNRYSKYIQEIICIEAHIWFPVVNNIVVREMTDKEYEEIQDDIQKEIDNRIKNQWELYKKHNNLSRPRNESDEYCDKVHKELMEKRRHFKYVKNISPEKQKEISDLEIRCEKWKEIIQQDEKDWEYLTKRELFRNGTLSKMQEEIDSCPNV
jgi:hypothetical protein